MQYSMTTPCDACPFLIGSGFTYESLEAHASGEFACHKTCKIDDDGNSDTAGAYIPRNKNTPHCAGALIFLELRDRPHQMMRICERLGLYDRRKLNMTAPVVKSRKDCRKESEHERKRRVHDR